MYNVVHINTGRIMAEAESLATIVDALIAAGWTYVEKTGRWSQDFWRDIGTTGYRTHDTVNVPAYEIALEIRMPYAEYKRDYADCKTKRGSYDASDKTIIVYAQ